MIARNIRQIAAIAGVSPAIFCRTAAAQDVPGVIQRTVTTDSFDLTAVYTADGYFAASCNDSDRSK